MNLFRFELIKLFRNKKTWAILIMTTLSLVFAIFQIERQHKALIKKEFEQTEKLYNLTHRQRYENYHEEDGSITAENQALIDELTDMKQTIKGFDQKRLAGDLQSELTLRIKFDQQAIAFLQAGGKIANLSVSKLEKSIEKYELLKQRNIKPTPIEAGLGGWYFVKYIADYWFSYIGILILLLLCYDIYTMEKETNSLKFLFVQPFSKVTVLRSKIMSNFFIYTTLFGFITVIVFIIGTIRHGTGSLFYPIAYVLNGQSYFTTLANYLVTGFIIQCLSSLFVLVYLFILSLWRHNSLEVLGFSLATLFFPLLIFKNVDSLSSIARWFPFYYFDVKSFLLNRHSYFSIYAIILLWLGISFLILIISIRRSNHEFS